MRNPIFLLFKNDEQNDNIFNKIKTNKFKEGNSNQIKSV